MNTYEDKLNDFVKVEIPIKWLVVLWHFWNDQSAREAFYTQYKMHNIDYRTNAEKLLLGEDWKDVHELLKILDINPDQIIYKDKITVQLNSYYTAKIDEDGVHVDCQTIPFKKVKELYKKIKKFKNQKSCKNY